MRVKLQGGKFRESPLKLIEAGWFSTENPTRQYRERNLLIRKGKYHFPHFADFDTFAAAAWTKRYCKK
jgi:hypothetical protein